MPRIRTIKPEFWQNEDLAAVHSETALLAIGLLNIADDEGYFKAHPALIEAAIFPIRDLSTTVRRSIDDLSRVGYIEVWTGVDGKEYGKVVKFKEHQRIDRAKPSKIKDIERIDDQSTINRRSIDGQTAQERKGKERKGKERNYMGDEPPQKAKRKIFTPPTYEEITSYMEEAGFKIDVAGFIDFYESKGWMVGKNKMKDWKSAARRAKKWECNIPLNGGANKKQRVGEQPAGRFVT